MKKKLIDTRKKIPKAVLAAVALKNQKESTVQEYLKELAFLATTLGINTIASFVQKLDMPFSTTYLGKGKLEEIKLYIAENPVDRIIFDDELSPSQVRNIENILKCKIVDRSLLILEIFAMRAKTAQAKTQVALAQYQYLLPRLTRLWTHLSKQKGGIGMRGPGEQELETDKRIVKDKIIRLKKRLLTIQQQNKTQKKQRNKLVRVALVGYTNVGKSTLMQVLSKKKVYIENKLFATVDATVSKVKIKDILLLLTDTVGFIRKIPHTLIACFQSTLEEVKNADLLLHILDSSTHRSFEDQMHVIYNTLADIHAEHIPIIFVLNKIDQCPENKPKDDFIEKVQKITGNKENYVCISALKKKNIEQLKAMVYKKIVQKHQSIYPNYL